MHSLRSISSGLDPGGLDAKALMAVYRVVLLQDLLPAAMRTLAAVDDARAPRVETREANILL